MIHNKSEVQKVLSIALAANISMAAAKWLLGYKLNSLSMMADGTHAISDAFSSILGLFTIHVASRPSDPKHHYGHYKYEHLAALCMAAMIGLTGWEIFKSGIGRLTSKSDATLSHQFELAGVIVMLVSLAINLFVSTYEKKKARVLGSSILEADAEHTKSDIWVTAAVLFSILASRLHIAWLDPVVSISIAGYLGWISFKIVRQLTAILSDAAYIDRERVKKLVQSVEGVISCHQIRTRGTPGSAFIDLHIQVPPDMTTVASHELAHQIEDKIRDEITGVHDVIIHTEPYPDPHDHHED